MATEMIPMRAYYDAQIQRYAQDRTAALALVKVGVAPVKSQLDPAHVAALMNVTAVVMNTPDAYSIH